MAPERRDVVDQYGPCHNCGKNIEEPEKPVEYRGNSYHQKCLPTKPEEKAKDASYT
ncbi:MAG: hypothetical protein WBF09_13785 [Candidatus Acidiferrum sp.]